MSDTVLKTHNSNTTHVDLNSRNCTATVQWFCELDKAKHPITQDNQLDIYMCGQQSFAEIAKDIAAAKETLDLICWGFDPGMELERKDNSAWPRGWVFGSMLTEAAGRDVKVRLLVWYDRLPSYIQNNLVGYTGDQRKGYLIDSPSTSAEDAMAVGLQPPLPVLGNDPRSPEQLRQGFCVQWWREALHGKIKNLEVKFRKGNPDAILKSLKNPASPEDMPSTVAPSHGGLINEYDLIVKNGTHHQKTVLIDYAREGGAKAVGYVMGLNSTSDYWDTAEHLFDTPLRETDWVLKSDTAKALGATHRISRDPLHDYVSRIRGAALQDVHNNFLTAWVRAKGQPHPGESTALPPSLPKVAGGSRIQIVRTQPEEGDKTIKNAYFQASGLARNYLYIENQYFFYERWVRHLKEKRAEFTKWSCAAGVKPRDAKLLHLFVVMPSPEDDGMVPRTYDMVKSLGEGQSMTGIDPRKPDGQKSVIEAAQEKYNNDVVAWNKMTPQQQMEEPGMTPVKGWLLQTSERVQEPVKNPKTGEIKALGLKVLIGRLITHNKGRPLPKQVSNYRQIYIHSKLMIIDDSFITLGSANMNLRSMAGDSEINMVTDDAAKAAELRRRVWGSIQGDLGNVMATMGVSRRLLMRLRIGKS
ncbi:phospholipase D family protein [Collimonas arenae]|uniref:phospholipase D-like domain-containing protein n=1 Tax=Collimonas arenae TaxID=279058 RepID=UPI0007782171|nr:phospholipase D-like domain-containing protein [Collimonas arenae]AMO99099.1 phospholipase D family protein [Collimonas arenae]